MQRRVQYLGGHHEGQLTAQQLVYDHAQRPHIHRRTAAIGARHVAQKLRRHLQSTRTQRAARF